MPRSARNFRARVVGQVQLDQRGAAHAVDEQQRVVAGGERQVLDDRAPAAAATISSAGASLIRSRPGSPWMPTPISISSSARVKDGSPECGTVHGVRAMPMVRTWALTRSRDRGDRGQVVPAGGGRAGDLLQQDGAADPAPAGGPGGVLDGHVVVDDHAGDLDVLGGGQLGGGLEVEHIAGVVLDDVQHAGAAVHGLRGGQHLVRGRRGEDRARRGGVEHPGADEAAVQWFVPAAATGDQRDLAPRPARRPG